MKIKFTTHSITRIAMVAAAYYALTVMLAAISYEAIQLRLAEMLILLAFYRREYGIGVIIGCFCANIHSPILVYDLTLGILSTIIPVVLIWYTKKLSLAAVWPVVFVGTIVGFELYLAYDLPLIIGMTQVAVGEAIVMTIGYFIFKKLETNKQFLQIIEAEKKEYPTSSLVNMVSGLSLVASAIMLGIFFSMPILQYELDGEVISFSIYEMLSGNPSLYLSIIIIILPLISGLFLLLNKHKLMGTYFGIICSIIPMVYLLFLDLSLESFYVFVVFILLLALYVFLLVNLFSVKRKKISRKIN